MTNHTEGALSEIVPSETQPEFSSRRALLRGAGMLGLAATGVYLAGCGGSDNSSGNGNNGTGGGSGGTRINARIEDATDIDILNYALNLEYLEAEYYLRGVTGVGLGTGDTGGSGTEGSVAGGRQVTFSNPVLRGLFQEIAQDELAHVRFLRTALGGSVAARPTINFTDAFNAAAQAAGIANSFDPFANETNFLIGAFVFEDVGVTAYKGGGRYIQNKAYLENAAGILAVEAIHAGAVRSLIYDAGSTAIAAATRIATLRFQAGGGKDEGYAGTIGSSDGVSFVPSDAQGRVYSRTPQEVHRIVYLQPTGLTSGGGFFPDGTNSVFKTVV